jgi:hypothetical protein
MEIAQRVLHNEAVRNDWKYNLIKIRDDEKQHMICCIAEVDR